MATSLRSWLGIQMKLFSTMPMPMPSPGSQITLPVLDSPPLVEALTPEVLLVPGLSVVLALVVVALLLVVVVGSPLPLLVPFDSELEFEPAVVSESLTLTPVVGLLVVGGVVGSTVVEG